MDFQPDYRQILQVLYNKRPERLPLYEHHIDPPFISKVLGREVVLQGNAPADLDAYYRELINFWKNMGYPAGTVCGCLPGTGRCVSPVLPVGAAPPGADGMSDGAFSRSMSALRSVRALFSATVNMTFMRLVKWLYSISAGTATMRPAAVVTSASATPAATTEGAAEPVCAMS